MRDTIAQRLREVRVRPTVGARERQRWDELMAAHHYLPFRTLVGRSLRHVAVLGERWLALIGWHAGAFKLRPRDEWIGWLPEQQFRRLHLLANNTRFVIMPEAQGVMNQASRVLGLSLRRVSDDFRAVHGHPVLIAEALASDCYSILRNSGFLGKAMKIRYLLELGMFLPVPLHRARWA